jgi:hypothetical protein
VNFAAVRLNRVGPELRHVSTIRSVV